MAREYYIQIATDGSGKLVKNFLRETIQEDNTIRNVYVQAVALVDEQGNPITEFATNAALVDIKEELQAIRALLEQIVK